MWYSSKKNEVGLVFIYDEMMLAELQKRYKAKMEFVSFAYIEGYKLFHYRKNVVALHESDSKGKRGNDRVFGSVYAVPDFTYNLITLDAYYYCSVGRLGYCSEHDMRDRVDVNCHLFDLDTIDTLVNHKYKIHTVIRASCWLGNKRDMWLMKHVDYGRYRIVDGIDKKNYKKLLEERGI